MRLIYFWCVLFIISLQLTLCLDVLFTFLVTFFLRFLMLIVLQFVHNMSDECWMLSLHSVFNSWSQGDQWWVFLNSAFVFLLDFVLAGDICTVSMEICFCMFFPFLHLCCCLSVTLMVATWHFSPWISCCYCRCFRNKNSKKWIQWPSVPWTVLEDFSELQE